MDSEAKPAPLLPYHETSAWQLDPRCDEELRRGCASGLSFRQIIETIHRFTGHLFTRNALIGRARRLHLARPEPICKPHAKMPKRKMGADGALASVIRNRVMPDLDLPPDPIVEPPTDLPFLGLTLMQLENRHCRFPRGGYGEGPILFCGQTKREDSAYCPFHHGLVYVRPKPHIPKHWNRP